MSQRLQPAFAKGVPKGHASSWVTGIACIAILNTAGCQRTPADYDDCMLSNVGSSNAVEAVTAVQRSCFAKFPIAFDWDQLAKAAQAKPWSEVRKDPEFLTLPKDKQHAAKEQYWREVLAPRVRSDLAVFAREQFVAHE